MLVGRGVFVVCLISVIAVGSRLLAVEPAVEDAVLAGNWGRVGELLDSAGAADSDPVAMFLMRQVCTALDRACAPQGPEGMDLESAKMWPCWEWVKGLKKKHPYNPVAVYLDAEAEALTGSRLKARAGYTEALELDDNFVLALFSRGALFCAMRLPSKAIEDYSRALELRPDFCKALINRGTVYDYTGEYWKAIADYKTALKMGRDSVAAFYNRGNTYRSMDDNHNAILDYSDALAIDSTCAAAYYNRGNTYYDKRDTAEAVADYKSFLKYAPEEMDLPKQIARTRIRELEGGGGGIEISRAYDHLMRGSAHYSSGRYLAAVEAFSDAIDADTASPEAYCWRGYTYRHLGDYWKAVGNFDRAILLHPLDTMAYFGRANCLSVLLRYKEAIEDFGRAVDLNPESAPAYYGRAWAYEMLGDYQSAIADYHQFRRRATRDQWERSPAAWEADSLLGTDTASDEKQAVTLAAAEAYRAVLDGDWPVLTASIRNDDLEGFRKSFIAFIERGIQPGKQTIRINGTEWARRQPESMELSDFFVRAMETIYPEEIPREELVSTKFNGIVDVALRGKRRALYRVRIVYGLPDQPAEIVPCYVLESEKGAWKLHYDAVRWWLRR